MKRTLIAWILLSVMVLGAVPALAAGPVRDVTDWSQAAGADTAAGADMTDGQIGPTQSVVSVSGGAYAAGGTDANAAQPGTENTPPVAENQQIQTYRGVSVGGQLSAHDAEGDALTYELCTEPMKGTVELSAQGYFVYTPKEGKRGKDYFGFRAVDSAGNASQEGTVIIRLVKQKSKVTYSDLTGQGCEYAAIALTEAGVFTAENVGSDYVFHPDAEVSRGEFLTMCMTAADCDVPGRRGHRSLAQALRGHGADERLYHRPAYRHRGDL